MGLFIYSRPEDNVAGKATVTASLAVSDYPATFLVDGSPGVPAKVGATTGWWLLDFGSPQRVDVAALIMTNLTAGLANVQIQGNSANSWPGAINVTLTIPAMRFDGTPTNPWVSLVGQAGYSTGGYRYWRLNFGSANGANISIGELVLLSTLRTLPYGLAPGATRTSTRRRVRHETDGGELLGYDLGVTQRAIRGEVEFKDAVKADVDAWLENSWGDLRPFLVVPNTDVNDAWYVTHTSEALPQTRVVLGMNRMPLEVMEVGAGIPT